LCIIIARCFGVVPPKNAFDREVLSRKITAANQRLHFELQNCPIKVREILKFLAPLFVEFFITSLASVIIYVNKNW
jgi:hypothetical protein